MGGTVVDTGTAGETIGTVLAGRDGCPVGFSVNVKLAVIIGTDDVVAEGLVSDELPSDRYGRGPGIPSVMVRVTFVVDVDPMGSVKVTTVWLTLAVLGSGSLDASGRETVAVPVQTVDDDGPSGTVTTCVVVSQPIPCGLPVGDGTVGSDVSVRVGVSCRAVLVTRGKEAETGPGPVGRRGVVWSLERVQMPGWEIVTVVAATVAVLTMELTTVSSVTVAGTDVLRGITVTVTVLMLAAQVEFALSRALVSRILGRRLRLRKTGNRRRESTHLSGRPDAGASNPQAARTGRPVISRILK